MPVFETLCAWWALLLEHPIWNLYFLSKLSSHQNTELKTSIAGQNNYQFLLLFLNSRSGKRVSVIFPKTVNYFIFGCQMILNNLLCFVEIHKLHAVSLKFGSFF